ncbi:MAG: ROK family transcriptional regulator [Pseudothermotoga sp.]
MKVLPAPALRKRNKLNVIRNIFDHKMMSRAQIARITNLSLSTLSYIIRELEQENLVCSEEILQGRGRPSQVVKINPSGWSVIGIKIGREEVRGTLFDAAMKPLKNHGVRVFSYLRNNDGYVQAFTDVLEHLLCDNLLGVGICSSGIVEGGKIVVSHLMNVNDLDFGKLLQKDYQIKRFTLMNDTDALCYALPKAERSDFLLITYGTGIGASFWTKGQAQHFEIGHAIVSSDGRCYCGQTGCLEYHASEYAVLKSYTNREIDFEDFARNEEEKYREIIEKVRSLAAKDFHIVETHYRKSLQMLGMIVGNLLMVLKPSTVFLLGEGMVNEQMARFLKEYIKGRFNREFVNDISFLIAKADWEQGVATATVHKFLHELVK